jgi:hypothetical protein
MGNEILIYCNLAKGGSLWPVWLLVRNIHSAIKLNCSLIWITAISSIPPGTQKILWLFASPTFVFQAL